MENIKKWPLCDWCNIKCSVISSGKSNFFSLFKNPFNIPDRYKCKRIHEREKFYKDKKELDKRSQELMNGCKSCGLKCHKPRRKNGKGGNDCKKYSKNEVYKSYIKMTLIKWNGKS